MRCVLRRKNIFWPRKRLRYALLLYYYRERARADPTKYQIAHIKWVVYFFRTVSYYYLLPPRTCVCSVVTCVCVCVARRRDISVYTNVLGMVIKIARPKTFGIIFRMLLYSCIRTLFIIAISINTMWCTIVNAY